MSLARLLAYVTTDDHPRTQVYILNSVIQRPKLQAIDICIELRLAIPGTGANTPPFGYELNTGFSEQSSLYRDC
jgi:hypothetical protein